MRGGIGGGSGGSSGGGGAGSGSGGGAVTTESKTDIVGVLTDSGAGEGGAVAASAAAAVAASAVAGNAAEKSSAGPTATASGPLSCADASVASGLHIAHPLSVCGRVKPVVSCPKRSTEWFPPKFTRTSLSHFIAISDGASSPVCACVHASVRANACSYAVFQQKARKQRRRFVVLV